MRTTTLRLGLPALLLAAAAGCNSGTGTLSVHLVDAPAAYDHIWLQILEVQIHGDKSGWKTLATRPATDPPIDLLSLTNGVVATLTDKAPLEPGRYSQLRLVLGDGNTVDLKDGTSYPLTVPSGLQTGVKVVCPLDVQAGSATDVFIDFVGSRSIFLHDTGVPGKYILRPVVFCVAGPTGSMPEAAAGSITGQLSRFDGESAVPLGAGLEVTAQVLDANGKGRVVQWTETANDGTYTLDLLPLGATYYVVSQPTASGVSWDAQSSGPIALGPSMPTQTWDPTFYLASGQGSVTGTIAPAVPSAFVDEVAVRQTFDFGGPVHLVVRSVEMIGPVSTETYAIQDLPVLPGAPPGAYSLSATRQSADGTGSATEASNSPVDVSVTNGAAATVDFTF